jgi:uncharacterized protein
VKNFADKKPKILSPCIRHCCLDDSDICLGCGRHLHEILRWQSASPDEQLVIINTARQRLVEKLD